MNKDETELSLIDLPAFPLRSRGTYRITNLFNDEYTTSEKLIIAKSKIKAIAELNEIVILLTCEVQGSGWLMLWWPANEVRHEANDEFIY